MRKNVTLLMVLALAVLLLTACQSPKEEEASKPTPQAEAVKPSATSEAPKSPPSGCDPGYRALYDNAVVELKGTGVLDILVLTDPLCWHCRLGHKLLGEYSSKYRNLRLSFFPRKSFIGSDMAAWIIEDAVGTDALGAKVDFAYTQLKQPKTEDLTEARMIVLMQFVQAFPAMQDGTTVEALYVRLQMENEAHVLKSAKLANAVDLPGTPILIAGKKVLMGYGADAWLTALDAGAICE